MDFRFDIKTEIIFKPRALLSIPELKEVNNQRCMLLRFPGFSNSALFAALEDKCEYILIPDKFEENPSVTTAKDLAKTVAANHIRTIIAIGGGSSIDTAKSAAWFAKNPTWDLTSEKQTSASNDINIVAVPTTAGTGSEVTPYAILTDSEKKKRILNHPSLIPNVALCDPQLTVSMPPHVTAHTGIDAICHSIEAYLSKQCNGLLADIALRSICRGVKTLPLLMDNPQNISARSEMMLSALEGGIVLAHCGTVMVHALGYCLTREFGYPHGLSNALLLGAFVEVLAHKGCERALQIMEIVNNDFSGFIRSCGIKNQMPAVNAVTIEEWAKSGYDSYGRNNCIASLEYTDIITIIQKSMEQFK